MDYSPPHSATVNNAWNYASTGLRFYHGEVTDTTLGQLHISQFLGTFANLRKATISFVMSVCQSVRPIEWNSALTGRIFMKFDNIWPNSS
jgi:hypothetical protein